MEYAFQLIILTSLLGVFCHADVDVAVEVNNTVTTDTASGVVKVYKDQKWQILCSFTFSDKDATVVCQELGYSLGKALPQGSYGRQEGTYTDPPLVGCKGDESSVLNCSFSDTSQINICKTSDINYAAVYCYNETTITPNSTVRLSDGYFGSVEYYNGILWGQVCLSYWSDLDATVLCHQLNFTGGVAMRYPASQNLPFTLTGVNCNGTEESLSSCLQDSQLICDLGDRRAGVLCYNTELSVSLRGEVGSHSGRVEVTYDGQVGTICRKSSWAKEADVICRQSGYTTGVNWPKVSQGTGPVFMSDIRCDGTESSIFMCDNDGWRNVNDSKCLSHYNDGVVYCFESVSLFGGYQNSKIYMGGVEIYHRAEGNKWTTLCADSFDQADVDVMCRQLGYTAGRVMSPNSFGRLLYRTFTTDLRCSGKEQSLLECQFKIGFCNSGDYASAQCINGSIHEDIKFALRKHYYGEVLVEMGGVNGTVCTDGWDDKDASVLCRSYGYLGGIVFGTSDYFTPLEPKLVSNIDCFGNESSLSECDFKFDILPSCGKAVAGAVCYNTSKGFDLRIVGSDSSNGRVEIGYDGVYGTVCDSGWSAPDATVVCRQKGYAYGKPFLSSHFGDGTGPVYMNHVNCGGTERTLFSCPNDGFKSASTQCASHSKDAGVSCSPWVKLNPIKQYGTVEFWSDEKKQYGRVCDDGFFNGLAANVTCQGLGMKYGGVLIRYSTFGPLPDHSFIAMSKVVCTGSESSLQDCKHDVDISACPSREYVTVVCTDIPISPSPQALVSIQSTNHGYIQVSHYYQDGLVCTEGFDNREAQVICKMNNYKTGIAFKYFTESSDKSRTYFGQRLRWLSEVECDGTEATLAYCNGLDWGSIKNCDKRMAAGVFCFTDSVSVQTTVTIVRPQSTGTSGRVSVTIGQSYSGDVCGDDFTEKEAGVFCRQAGYRDGAVLASGTFGNANNMLLERVHCHGNESNFLNCLLVPMDPFIKCSDGSAAVKCYSTVRLTGTNSPDYGRVEIHNGNEWQAICDDGFDNTAAAVVCKFLGYTTGWHQCCSAVGPLTDTKIEITDMKCSGTEVRPQDCQYNVNRQCQSGRYVSVFCSQTAAVEDLAVRLPLSSHYGPVEVRRYGLWGHICDVGWNDDNANVVCKTMGFKSGQAVYTYAQDKLPVIIGNISCSGSESSVKSCARNTFQEGHSCYIADTVAGVICLDRDGPLQLQIRGSGTDAYFYIQAGSKPMVIDSAEFDDNSAGVFCRDVDRVSASKYVDGKAFKSKSSYQVSASKLRCKGMETSYLQCKAWWDPRLQTQKFLAAATCHFSVRLANRFDNFYGIVEAYQQTTKSWGTLCAQKFGKQDAEVVCKTLGFDGGQDTCCAPFGALSSQMTHYDVQCSGTETDFNQCNYKTIKPNTIPLICDTAWNYASVVCYKNSKPTGYTVELPHNSNLGEVTLRYLGVRGRICYDGWDDNDARVICRQLNYNGGMAYTHAVEMGVRSHGPYWASQVNCTGTESELNQCSHLGFGNVQECKSHHYAGVICFNDQGIYFRIAGGDPFSQYGRLEVYLGSGWASVCDSYWDQTEAQVTCKQFGYSTGDPYYGTYNLPPPNQAYDTKFRCTGQENHLNECPHSGWFKAYSARCTNHKNDAGVFCYKTVKLHQGIGRQYKAGAVLIYRDNSWHLVCDNDFSDVSAEAVCKDIGFTYGRSKCCSSHGDLSVNSLRNFTIKCQSSYRDVSECVVEEPCKHKQYASVECSFSPFPTTTTTTTTSMTTTVAATVAPEKATQADNTGAIIAVVLSVILVIAIIVIAILVYKTRRRRLGKEHSDFHDSFMHQRHDGSFHIENPLHQVQEEEEDDNLVNIKSSGTVAFRTDSDPVPYSYNNPNYSTLPVNKSVVTVGGAGDDYQQLGATGESHVYNQINSATEDMNQLNQSLAQHSEIPSPTDTMFKPNFPSQDSTSENNT